MPSPLVIRRNVISGIEEVIAYRQIEHPAVTVAKIVSAFFDILSARKPLIGRMNMDTTDISDARIPTIERLAPRLFRYLLRIGVTMFSPTAIRIAINKITKYDVFQSVSGFLYSLVNNITDIQGDHGFP